MVQIAVNNSYSHITGLKINVARSLRKLLSYETDPKATFFSGGYSRPKYLIDKHGLFPTGLLYLIQQFLIAAQIKYILVDARKRPSSIPSMFKIDLGDKQPYKDQLKAVNTAVKEHRGGIQMATGSGKSLVIALIASRLNVKTLVVVPTLELKKQLKTQLQSLFGTNPNIVVENIDSTLLQSDDSYDCLIIDECHHAAAKTYQTLNKKVWNNIYYRFFLTATFFRNNENEQLLFEGIAGKLIYSLSIKDAISKKYIVPIEVYYYDLPKQRNDYYSWSEVYSKLVVNNKYRNELIANLLIKLKLASIATLCLVKEIHHGEIISDITNAPFANGQNYDTRIHIDRFNSGTLKFLIGTTGILGEGVDTRPAEYIIIAGLGKAKSAFLQQIGRGVRMYPGKESCKIILFRDISHKFTMRHYRTQCRILKDELGIVPIKLEIK